MSDLERGDIVQITDEWHTWYRMFIVVTAVKAEGIEGYAVLDLPRKSGTTWEWVRLEHSQFTKVGRAAILPLAQI